MIGPLDSLCPTRFRVSDKKATPKTVLSEAPGMPQYAPVNTLALTSSRLLRFSGIPGTTKVDALIAEFIEKAALGTHWDKCKLYTSEDTPGLEYYSYQFSVTLGDTRYIVDNVSKKNPRGLTPGSHLTLLPTHGNPQR